mmetsp:Transcript_12147/g.28515  ORF Transcript_12147/g.28515 Transcript_12147/m.28515 type:complete len:231 (-) Transcript_12147:84-776(-)
MRAAMEHLLARYRDIRPLFLADARPMNDEWKMRPYLGVLPLVLSARKSAFSAPKICTVEAGYFARFVREPAWEMSRAPTVSPTSEVRLGATAFMRSVRYAESSLRYAESCTTRSANAQTLATSTSEISIPMEWRAASTMARDTSGSSVTCSSPGTLSSLRSSLRLINITSLANRMLSPTILTSSGKCQEYHSFTRMAKVFRSLSSWSKRQMDWMIMLSARWTLNLTFERE